IGARQVAPGGVKVERTFLLRLRAGQVPYQRGRVLAAGNECAAVRGESQRCNPALMALEAMPFIAGGQFQQMDRRLLPTGPGEGAPVRAESERSRAVGQEFINHTNCLASEDFVDRQVMPIAAVGNEPTVGRYRCSVGIAVATAFAR